jgi:hypothetical protein
MRRFRPALLSWRSSSGAQNIGAWVWAFAAFRKTQKISQYGNRLWQWDAIKVAGPSPSPRRPAQGVITNHPKVGRLLLQPSQLDEAVPVLSGVRILGNRIVARAGRSF